MFRRSVIDAGGDGGGELLELRGPIVKHAQRAHYEELKEPGQ